MNISSHAQRLVKALSIGITVVAMNAPLAQAEVWPNGREGAGLATEMAYPDVVERTIASHKTQILAPDDRLRVRRPEAQSEQMAPPRSVAGNGKSFDWEAAAIGASTTTALLFALAVGVGLTRRSRSAAAT